MSKILVTGMAGFIGKHLVKKLTAKGHEVKGYDLYWQQNILDSFWLEKEIKDVDAVIHLAALVDVQQSFKQPEEYYRTNIVGTMNVLYACLKYKKKLIYPSTAAIYNPLSSPYAHSKYLAEEIIKQFLSHPIVILRLFNIYGEGMKPTTMIARFMNENPITVYGKDMHTRDFIHVDQVADIMAHALDSKWNGLSMDIGTGTSHSVSEIASWFHKPIIYKTARKEVETSCADVTELRKLYKKPFMKLKTYIDNNRQ